MINHLALIKSLIYSSKVLIGSKSWSSKESNFELPCC